LDRFENNLITGQYERITVFSTKSETQISLSYAEEDTSGNRGAAVALAQFRPTSSNPKLENFEVIWRQNPATNLSRDKAEFK